MSHYKILSTMKLIIYSLYYESLISCLRSYRGQEPLGNVFIYVSDGKYYCVLDNLTLLDFRITDKINVIPPYSEIELFKHHD